MGGTWLASRCPPQEDTLSVKVKTVPATAANSAATSPTQGEVTTAVQASSAVQAKPRRKYTKQPKVLPQGVEKQLFTNQEAAAYLNMRRHAFARFAANQGLKPIKLLSRN